MPSDTWRGHVSQTGVNLSPTWLHWLVWLHDCMIVLRTE